MYQVGRSHAAFISRYSGYSRRLERVLIFKGTETPTFVQLRLVGSLYDDNTPNNSHRKSQQLIGIENRINDITNHTKATKPSSKRDGDNWRDFEHQLRFIRSFAIEHQIEDPKDWNKVTGTQIKKWGGSGLLKQYKSLKDCLSCLIPEYSLNFDNVKDTRVPKHFWEHKENQKNFMDMLSKRLNMKEPKDWDNLTTTNIIDHGGRQLFNLYSSVHKMLISIYPSEQWDAFTIPRLLPRGYWESPSCARQFLSKVVELEGVSSPFEVTDEAIIAYGGKKFKKSMQHWCSFLLSIFPELENELEEWKDVEKQRKYLLRIGKEKLSVTEPEDWKRIKFTELHKHGTCAILHHYKSHKQFISTVFPELVEKKRKILSHSEQRARLDSIADSLSLETDEDWNSLSIVIFRKLGGDEVLQPNETFVEMLQRIYPEKEWNVFAFHLQKLYPTFWESIETQRKFMDYVAQKKNIKTPEDWKLIQCRDIDRLGGNAMVRKYKKMDSMLQAVYPDYNWREEILRKYPSNHWKNSQNCRDFFDFLSKKFQLKSKHELLYIGPGTIGEHGGTVLLDQFDSYSSLLRSLYPEESWIDLTSTENQKVYLEDIATNRLSIKKLSDWYKVSHAQFRECGGAMLLEHYDTMIDVLTTLHPNYKWDFEKRGGNMPRHYWDNFEHVRQFMKKVERHYGVNSPEDWYRISQPQIASQGGSRVLAIYSMIEILRKLYPSVQWNQAKLARKDKRSTQKWLFTLVQDLFQSEVIEDYYHSDSRASGGAIQFDVFLPHFRVAFEYHGEHHYEEIPTFGTVDLYRERDREKVSCAQLSGVTLVHVPYWWDRSKESLLKIIDHVHPSILFQIREHETEPIK